MALDIPHYQEESDEPEFAEDTIEGLSDEEFIALATSHYDKTLWQATKMVGAQDAEDIAQESWLRAWAARKRFQQKSRPETWMYSIVANRGKTELVSTNRRKIDRTIDQSHIENLVSEEDEFDEEVIKYIENQERLRPILEFVAEHRPSKVQLLGLIAAGASGAVIMQKLGKRTESAAKVAKHRLIKDIRDNLIEED